MINPQKSPCKSLKDIFSEFCTDNSTNAITNINKSMSYAAEREMKFFLSNNLWYKCGSNLSKTPTTRH